MVPRLCETKENPGAAELTSLSLWPHVSSLAGFDSKVGGQRQPTRENSVGMVERKDGY